MTLTNQALSSAADKDLELSKQVCREAVNEVIEKNHLTLSPQFTQNLVVVVECSFGDGHARQINRL